MSVSDVTRDGIKGARPGRDAMVGVVAGTGRRGERAMVPDAAFTSYYGKPVINKPTWKAPDIPGYLYCGGLAGASSVLALGAELTGRYTLARSCKLGALGSLSLGLVGLVHDLGRPGRFLNMLRVFKPTSPMNMGSWLLAGYGPMAGAAVAADVTGRLPRLGLAATAAAAVLGPPVAAYTGALICDTAVPSWHDAFREMPFIFAGSGASAAGGLGMLASPIAEAGPARRAALFGSVVELAGERLMERRLGDLIGEPYHVGKSGTFMRVGKILTTVGTVGAVTLARRSRTAAAVCGSALMVGSAFTRFGIFGAGLVSADDPAHTVVPQRNRLAARSRESSESAQRHTDEARQ
jgi:hypothetical protein